MEFSFSPSPAIEVTLCGYEPQLFPQFRVLFDPPQEDSPLRFLAQRAEEAEFAVVMENHSEKDVTAMRYNWVMTSDDGNIRKRTVSSDSYMVEVYCPVLKPGDRLLICRSTTIHQSVLDHVLKGGGVIGAGAGSTSPLSGVKSLRFEIDMLLFSDGELVGPDTRRFAAELNCRKPAAEFIAKQVRASESEHRDVTPVLSALAQIPHLRDDYLAHWTKYYASWYLRRMGREHIKDGLLQHLENRLTLPKFYRR